MDKNSVGYRIRFYREKAKLNQSQLASRIGKSQEHISKIEKGRAKPSFETLISISNELEVNVDDLISDYITKDNLQLSNMSDSLITLLEDLPAMKADVLHMFSLFMDKYIEMKQKTYENDIKDK